MAVLFVGSLQCLGEGWAVPDNSAGDITPGSAVRDVERRCVSAEGEAQATFIKMSREAKQRQVLYSWGSNSYGQLGHSNTNDAILPQHVVGFPDEWQVIKGISAGGGHSAIITDAGKLYVCGQNKDGQLGLSHTDDVPRFTLCMPIQSSRVAKVACGWDFTIILTECGDILSCGANAFGQLGRPQAGTCTIPQRVEIPDKKKIMDVAAGLRHSLALTERGEIFQWGTGLASHAKRFSPENPS
ncbi:secretion-regulating guanine nucleotide exchange factor-like [Rhinophrynus dorsalis]